MWPLRFCYSTLFFGGAGPSIKIWFRKRVRGSAVGSESGSLLAGSVISNRWLETQVPEDWVLGLFVIRNRLWGRKSQLLKVKISENRTWFHKFARRSCFLMTKLAATIFCATYGTCSNARKSCCGSTFPLTCGTLRAASERLLIFANRNRCLLATVSPTVSAAVSVELKGTEEFQFWTTELWQRGREGIMRLARTRLEIPSCRFSFLSR